MMGGDMQEWAKGSTIREPLLQEAQQALRALQSRITYLERQTRRIILAGSHLTRSESFGKFSHGTPISVHTSREDAIAFHRDRLKAGRTAFESYMLWHIEGDAIWIEYPVDGDFPETERSARSAGHKQNEN